METVPPATGNDWLKLEKKQSGGREMNKPLTKLCKKFLKCLFPAFPSTGSFQTALFQIGLLDWIVIVPTPMILPDTLSVTSDDHDDQHCLIISLCFFHLLVVSIVCSQPASSTNQGPRLCCVFVQCLSHPLGERVQSFGPR